MIELIARRLNEQLLDAHHYGVPAESFLVQTPGGRLYVVAVQDRWWEKPV